MSIESGRLLSLIEYAQQSALLRSTPASAVSQHRLFALYEHELQGLPGIRLNNDATESEDEIWLAVERIHETKPPDITSTILQPWVQMGQGPTDEPKLLETIAGSILVDAGTHRSSHTGVLSRIEEDRPATDPNETLALSDYDKAAQVSAEFDIYVNTEWRPWSDAEIRRRKTIRLYSELFTLKQQLEGDIVEAQLELVWGVGVGIWSHSGTEVRYPLVGRLVELALNSENAELQIRPRDLDARLEVDWYAANDNPGVAELEKAAKEFFQNATKTFSPYDRGTFEPLLLTAAANLDANGVYWPNQAPPEDRTLPKPDDKLKVTDTWVLFARPRTNSLFLQDLEKLKKAAEAIKNPQDYPPAVAAVVTDPETSNPVVVLPSFRGVSASYHSDDGSGASEKKAHDLYFPKPFNDEQVRIIQLLDISDGVVVQGPPGTGKTHTIANVICHYLAEGKRVLVTSLKDPALAVLQEQLPEDIRPLAISLLTSEQKGMKQFEHSIHKIASEVQGLDRGGTQRAIGGLEESIDALHSKLASIDHKIGDWAKRNLSKVALDAEEIDPQDAARDVVENTGHFEWIPDALRTDTEFTPQFSDADIIALRDARRALGQDIDYLGASLPQLVEFPDSKALLEVHQDLSQFEILKQAVANGDVPALADSSHETLTIAQELLAQIVTLQDKRDEVSQAGRPWTISIRQHLRRGANDDMFKILENLGTELEQAQVTRKVFIERPVVTPDNVERDSVFVEAVENLAEGKSAFGLKGIFGKSGHKKLLEGVSVLGARPNGTDDWIHVNAYLCLQRRLRELALRWTELARDLDLDPVGDNPSDGLIAAQDYALYLKVKSVVEVESKLCAQAIQVFPNWADAREVADNEQRLDDLKRALQHHLTKNRLANVWALKERFQKVLEGRDGRIICSIRDFLAQKLGNPTVDDAQMQAEWSALMAELARVLGLGTYISTVQQVCGKIEDSGAPKYAEALRKPLNGTVDSLLPDNWRSAWRLRRLATYLESIDAREELKKLAKKRHEVANDLSRAYSDLVVKRTWLKLAENASPSIRSALQAYLNAIQKIGKGTGKRAMRYRQDARMAASLANPAVPCWIMPHYRVSETLPAELGCFDLVVIDEASQSDLSALPALLRAQKVLIVGDDKQVSPEGVGLDEEKVRSLMNRFLGNQVVTYGSQMSPERSIYDLYKVVFAKSTVMLKEHFRCVGPIIEYSKREFYNHELRPLRVPRATERIDPPLVDILVTDGYRRGEVNIPEVRVIVDEIKAIVADPRMANRTIGVVSLLADKQPMAVWARLTEELGPELIERHSIACGDSRTFQGKQRDIMFLSMVSAPNEVGAPLARDAFAQRFNVAASRARDRMYLVRSVDLEHLSDADRLRRNLIAHFAAPFAQDELRVEDFRTLCESPFERELFDELTQRGYWVTPQVRVGQYRIDMVVEGHNDARLAVECDGDKYHGADKWTDDLQRQRVLERAGWVFWRCFASAFIRRRSEVLEDLMKTLTERGIDPIGAEGAPRSLHTERRTVSSVTEQTSQDGFMSIELHETVEVPTPPVPPTPGNSASSNAHTRDVTLDLSNQDRNLFDGGQTLAHSDPVNVNLASSEYVAYDGPAGDDPRSVSVSAVAEGFARIIEVEGPVVAKRVYDIYLRGCGIKRMGHEIKGMMNKALAHAIRQGRVVSENEANDCGYLYSVVRIKGSAPIRLRNRGPRSFEEIPPSELLVVARCLEERCGFVPGSEDHLRAVLEFFDLKRLTTQVDTTLRKILAKRLSSVEELLDGTHK